MDKHNKMLIDATHPEETRVVVLRDGRVEEFDFESASRKPLRGNIYLAKVTRVEPSLQAAFVDYGGNRHGFLAFSEIHPDYYQIPMADRQALLDEEMAAEAEAEAEADARAEAQAGRGRQDNRHHHHHDERHDDDHDAGHPDDHHSSDQDRGEHDADETREAHEAHEAKAADAEHGQDAAAGGGAVPGEPAAAATAHTSSLRHGDPQAEPFQDQDATKASDDHDHDHDHDHRDNAEGEHHVEEVGGDSAEAPEELSPVENASQDALEELPERPRRRMRSYKIQEVIKRRQIILVQVVKEERGNKGAALTTYLSLAGRYTVLMPNTGRGGGISRKITNPQDRKRLKAIATELEVPEGMGLIIRTAGAARTKQEIKRDFEYEIRLWENVREMTLRSTAPCLVYEEGNLIKRSIRDLYSKDIDDIVVAGEAGHHEALEFMKMLSPSQTKNVVKYEGGEPLFHRYQIERQLNAMFSPFVTLRSGGYLVINQTEALVAVDVNSGKSTREFSIEETALNTNLEAAEEIARQLKLRDLAGLIVIDFIDMEEKRNNRAVERRLKDCLRHDRARIQVGRISHFGLLEMSRQRLRTGVLEGSTTQCPHCQGTGIIRSVESVALAVLRGIEDHLLRDQRHSVTALTTAEVALYILNHKRAFITAMENRYGLSIAVQASEKMQGANFAVERAHAAPQPRQPERAAVNMDWGFDGQDDAEGEDEEAGRAQETRSERHENGDGRDREGREGRRRRRRRRGRRDDRGEDRNGPRAQRHEANGNGHDGGFADDAEAEEGSRHEAALAHEGEEQPAADFQELVGDPDAEGNVPRRKDAEADAEDRGDREERGGRRRRRGRRGGRRGRDRDVARQDDGNGEQFAADDAEGGPDDEPSEAASPQDASADSAGAAAGSTVEKTSEPAQSPVTEAQRQPEAMAPEAAPVASAPELAEQRVVTRPVEPAVRIPSVEPVAPAVAAEPVSEPEPAPAPALRRREEPKPVEIVVHSSAEEDNSRPLRKGWWQRRFTAD